MTRTSKFEAKYSWNIQIIIVNSMCDRRFFKLQKTDCACMIHTQEFHMLFHSNLFWRPHIFYLIETEVCAGLHWFTVQSFMCRPRIEFFVKVGNYCMKNREYRDVSLCLKNREMSGMLFTKSGNLTQKNREFKIWGKLILNKIIALVVNEQLDPPTLTFDVRNRISIFWW